jgi:transcriptional regulator with XRE-family HTH domain
MVNVERIKELATAKGLTIAALERKADLGNGVIATWESENGATINSLQKVARALECPIAELLKEAE